MREEDGVNGWEIRGGGKVWPKGGGVRAIEGFFPVGKMVWSLCWYKHQSSEELQTGQGKGNKLPSISPPSPPPPPPPPSLSLSLSLDTSIFLCASLLVFSLYC